MRKKINLFIFLFLFMYMPNVGAQNPKLGANNVETVKEGFIQHLRSISTDSAIIQPLTVYVEAEVNGIHSWLKKNKSLNNEDKQKSFRSLVFFLKELSLKLSRNALTIYDVPEAILSYKNVLKAIVGNQPPGPALQLSGPQHSQVVASAFSQYQQHRLLDDIAIYQTMASSPEFILQFLEKKPGFQFSDSLLLSAAAADPLKIIYYMGRNKNGVQERFRNTSNMYLQQIAMLSADKHVSELLPFVTQIADKKLTPQEILVKRMAPLDYFQLLVNTLQESVDPDEPDPVFLQPLRRGVKDKALAFYVNELNDLHSSNDLVRFASVKTLRPQDLYYVIVSCGEDLYTSSYLGLYKRLMGHFNQGVADSLFDIVEYDQFRTFIRLAANYNVLPDLLQRLSPGKKEEILARLISGVEKDETSALGKSMDIADSFVALSADSTTREFVAVQLHSNLHRARRAQHYLGMRLYGILTDMFGMVSQPDGMKKLWVTLGDYETLKRSALEDKNGAVTELILFYGDEDGINSFGNFLRSFSNSKWQITKNDQWVSIRSTQDTMVTMYANRPLDMKEGLDLRAQDSLIKYLNNNALQPSLLMHRGHSYHLDKTMHKLTPSVKLAILGSCGGYNKTISISEINADVQVIGSKKTGAGAINDPIIERINESLTSKNDISWPQVWTDLSQRFAKDESARALFNEYFPPSNNLGLFVLKLFKYYNRSKNI